jgi:hypothetical protein
VGVTISHAQHSRSSLGQQASDNRHLLARPATPDTNDTEPRRRFHPRTALDHTSRER